MVLCVRVGLFWVIFIVFKFYGGNEMKRIMLIVAAIGLLGLSACGSSGGGIASNTVTGAAAKGPYQIGSTVEVFTLVNGARQIPAVATGSITDVLGNYTVTIPGGTPGPFEIVVAGRYLDETTGALSASSQPTSLIFTDAAAVGAGGAVNMNPISTIQTELVKAALVKASTNGTTVNVAQTISSSGDLALQALGINTVDANGNKVDPRSLDILNPADPAIGAQALAASALIAELVNNAGASVGTLATAMAKDIAAGKAPGAVGSDTAITAGVTSANFTTASTAVKAIDIAAQLNNAIAVADPTAAPSTITSVQANAATAAQPNPAVLRGLGMSNNSFTVGTAAYTVANTGVASTAGSTSVNNVVLGFTLVDLGNAAGTGGFATTYSTSFNFKIKSTTLNDNRIIQGSISPVTVVTDGAGAVAITVPVNAVLHFSGIDSAGLTVASAPAGVTNLGANIIQTNANVVSIDANTLLNTIQSKVGNAQLNILQRAGVFSFDFSLGLNIGSLNLANSGLLNLYSVTGTGGRGVTGTLTTF